MYKKTLSQKFHYQIPKLLFWMVIIFTSQTDSEVSPFGIVFSLGRVCHLGQKCALKEPSLTPPGTLNQPKHHRNPVEPVTAYRWPDTAVCLHSKHQSITAAAYPAWQLLSFQKSQLTFRANKIAFMAFSLGVGICFIFPKDKFPKLWNSLPASTPQPLNM